MIHVIGNAAIDTIMRIDRFPLPGETIIAVSDKEALQDADRNADVVCQ